MIAVKQVFRDAIADKRVRLAIQTVVSVALIGYLVRKGLHYHLAVAWAHIGLLGLLLACGCFMVAAVLSARRWQLFLRFQDIHEPLTRLTELYCIGLFCSLFLPTAAGGDASGMRGALTAATGPCSPSPPDPGWLDVFR